MGMKKKVISVGGPGKIPKKHSTISISGIYQYLRILMMDSKQMFSYYMSLEEPTYEATRLFFEKCKLLPETLDEKVVVKAVKALSLYEGDLIPWAYESLSPKMTDSLALEIVSGCPHSSLEQLCRAMASWSESTTLAVINKLNDMNVLMISKIVIAGWKGKSLPIHVMESLISKASSLGVAVPSLIDDLGPFILDSNNKVKMEYKGVEDLMTLAEQHDDEVLNKFLMKCNDDKSPVTVAQGYLAIDRLIKRYSKYQKNNPALVSHGLEGIRDAIKLLLKHVKNISVVKVYDEIQKRILAEKISEVSHDIDVVFFENCPAELRGSMFEIFKDVSRRRFSEIQNTYIKVFGSLQESLAGYKSEFNRSEYEERLVKQFVEIHLDLVRSCNRQLVIVALEHLKNHCKSGESEAVRVRADVNDEYFNLSELGTKVLSGMVLEAMKIGWKALYDFYWAAKETGLINNFLRAFNEIAGSASHKGTILALIDDKSNSAHEGFEVLRDIMSEWVPDKNNQ